MVQWICCDTWKADTRTAEGPPRTKSESVHYLFVGFLVMLGAMAAIASAPVIFAVALVAAKLIFVVLIVGVIAGIIWFVRSG